ncbi:hypothetical protein NEIELOOT_00677 [Neisseria elongata subsp. glycolytica ATCC 29315]|jgi:putative magnesium chelatase, chlI subunit|uniref:Uncharacterized protein n=2 Tax=Neisseria elongata subsp. glycolytica ATCC 29315 TaxID=546263 RepID=D4DNP4_NEIEG|nr:hypothetical protein NEIELOOT_00677 [Neisseria elongata subsp. glycolytica ATCC 29315]
METHMHHPLQQEIADILNDENRLLDTLDHYHIQALLLESALVVLRQQPKGLEQLRGLLLIALERADTEHTRYMASEALIELEAHMAGVELIYPPNRSS